MIKSCSSSSPRWFWMVWARNTGLSVWQAWAPHPRTEGTQGLSPCGEASQAEALRGTDLLGKQASMLILHGPILSKHVIKLLSDFRLRGGQERKKGHETRHPEPSEVMEPTLLGLAFKTHLFHPDPAFPASLTGNSGPFQTRQQASHTYGPLFRQALLEGRNARPLQDPLLSSGSLPGLPSRGHHHFCSVLPQPLSSGASVLQPPSLLRSLVALGFSAVAAPRSGESGEAQGAQPGGCCRVRVEDDHLNKGGEVEMETWTHWKAFLDLLMG